MKEAKHVILMRGNALHDRDVIENNGSTFEIFKIPRDEQEKTEISTKDEERLCDAVKRFEKEREQQDVALLMSALGCDKGKAKQMLEFHKRKKK